VLNDHVLVTEKNYEQWVSTVESAARHQKVDPARALHELDRLAEHLVGETNADVQHVKLHVQQLISEFAPERHDVQLYSERYCSGGS
jgi:hypothetical protein